MREIDWPIHGMVKVRASALGTLFDCAARFEAMHLLGMRMASSAPATIGHAVHKGAAVFDQARLDGNPLRADEAAGAVVDVIRKPPEDVDWADDSPSDAEKIALSLHAKYCERIAPHQKYIAVEVTCESLEIPELGLELTGTADRIRQVPLLERVGHGVADLKTGRTAVVSNGTVETAEHKVQVGVYEILAERSLDIPIDAPGQVIGMTTAKTPAHQRVETGEVRGARDLLLGDDTTPGLLEMASRMIHGGILPGNPRSWLCGKRFCAIYDRCRYR
jgi:hypothetical protein